jgi:hypothetical protein
MCKQFQKLVVLVFVVALVVVVLGVESVVAQRVLGGNGIVEFSQKGEGANRYLSRIATKPITQEGLYMWYDRRDDSGQTNLSPKFAIFDTLGGGSSVYTSDSYPSVGIGSGFSQHPVRVSMGDHKTGKMVLAFNQGTKYAGFHTIRNQKENVRVLLKSGSAAINWKVGWSMPVVSFKNSASGYVASGNLMVEIDKNHNLTIRTRQLEYYHGATPLVVRASNNPWEFHFTSQGSVKEVLNPDF